MSRHLRPGTSLEQLRKEAKRWLKALRAGDPSARAQLDAAVPHPLAAPGLRDVQHALAREYGFRGWTALKAAVERASPLEELLAAAERGDPARVAELLDLAPHLVSERGVLTGHTGPRTALHFAAEQHDAVVRLLLQRGADPNIRDEGDNAFPLHFAAERGRLDIVRLLVEAGADPIGADDGHGLEVIGWATCFRDVHVEVVEYLLAHGARHTIFSAVATGAVGAIRALVAGQPDDLMRRMDVVNHRRTPLHLAVVRRQPGSLVTLLDLGADTEAEDAGALTPLDLAALEGVEEMARLLLDRGARLRLPAAVGLGRTADMVRLLREEPDALRANHRLGTLIVRAAGKAPGAVIEAMIRAGASPNGCDDPATAVDETEGYTALHAAAWHGNADAARALLRLGADPAARETRYAGTPAGWADYAGHHAVRDLILASDRIDIFDAIAFDLVDRIPAILARDPDALERPFGDYVTPDPRGPAGRPDPATTPLAWAEQAGKNEAAAVLREHAGSRAHRVARFLWNACPDHHIRGQWAHPMALRAAEGLLAEDPGIANDSFVTAVVSGDLAAVERALAEQPALAREKAGPRGWEPLLYLCFTRLSLRAVRENAVAIARLLLDHGADPDVDFMAGDSRYTPLVGAIGEGEEGRPPHPARDGLVRLLLERDAEPYDIQVLYNIHFVGDALWLMPLIHQHSVRRGRAADWDDPLWSMLDMGGYGCGARYLLDMALRRNDLKLAEWLLAHGADPDAPPARDPRLSKRSLHGEALRRGLSEFAALLERFGAAAGAPLDGEAAFGAACLRGDRAAAEALLRGHPEYLRNPAPIFEAARRDDARVVAMLLEFGVPPEIASEEPSRHRPLHEAAWNDAPRVAELLLARGVEVDPRDLAYGATPLGWAVHGQRLGMIELLGGVSRDVWNLVFTGKVERLRAVLAAEPGLAEAQLPDGETPLMRLPDDDETAVQMVELLLACGADPSRRDARGRTAAEIGRKRGLPEAAARLERAS